MSTSGVFVPWSAPFVADALSSSAVPDHDGPVAGRVRGRCRSRRR